MPKVGFAPAAENFIETVGTFLSKLGLSLKLRQEIAANQSRVYEVKTPNGAPVEVLVHRTARSLRDPNPEYRVRVSAETPAEFGEFARNKGDLVNHVATLGAMLPSENAVVSQCLIPIRCVEATAGLLAVAIAHGRRSLINANMKASRRERDTVERLSAWTDLDFEEIHYDHAHLGIGRIRPRGWSTDVFPGPALLTLDAVHNNPDWGGGLLCLLRVPKTSVVKDDETIDAVSLNSWSNLVGETPAFGAWCSDGDAFVFVQFVPNFVRGLPQLTDLLIDWACARSIEIKHLAEYERERLRSGGRKFV